MNGIVDVGGGLRGIYTAGIYDYLLDCQIEFDYCLGVSAGSANLITYLAKQKGRSKRFYVDYALRKEYMGLGNLLKKGSYIDVNYIYSILSNSDGEDPIDYDTYRASTSNFVVVATDAVNGKPHYFTRADIQRDHYDILKASCALPIACKPYSLDGGTYFDGGISDPVPFQKALDDGCTRIVVLLTRPRSFVRPPQKHMRVAKIALRSYPKALECLRQRHVKYNAAVAAVKQLEKEGKALLLAPANIDGMDTLTKDTARMEKLYEAGYQDGAKVRAFLRPQE